MIDIGTYGLWHGGFDAFPTARNREAIAEVDAMGWGCMWIPETVGRDPFVQAAVLLEASSSLKIATGIASMWARDAMTTANATKTLNEAYDGRFLLGLGASHHTITEWVRKLEYSRPLATMRAYLERMDKSMFKGVEPAERPTRVIAALGPKMLALGAEMTDGVHPYFVPPEHSAIAREAVGPDKIVASEQMVILESDPVRAREVARKHMKVYVGLPNYANNLLRLGFDEAEITEMSDRLVDAIVAWGSVDDVVKRVQEHLDAGASHVCIQVLGDEPANPLGEWRRLADALL